MVLIPVSVVDAFGRTVMGLDKDQFTLFEDNQRKSIETVSSDDTPISISIIFDASRSMRDKIEMARSAASQFVRMANPEDEFSLISFSDNPELVVDFGDSIDDTPVKLAQTVPHGQTALVDAIDLGIRSMRQAKYRRRALL